MKKQMHSIQLFLLAGLLITGFALNANNNAVTANSLFSVENIENFNGTFTYSWTAESGTESYTVEMVNTATQENFSWKTTQTSITAFGLPNGTYDLTVIANASNNTSSIIITDMITH